MKECHSHSQVVLFSHNGKSVNYSEMFNQTILTSSFTSILIKKICRVRKPISEVFQVGIWIVYMIHL